MKNKLYKMAQLCEAVYEPNQKLRLSRFDALGYESLGWFDEDGTQAALLRSHTDNINYLVFRGTDEVSDWLSNLDVLKTKTRFGYVHSGFNEGVDSVWKEFLLAHQGDGDRNKYIVAGHSLGAAEAVIASTRLANYENVDVLGVYLFGCPRVGGYTFKYPKIPTYRVVNNVDIVCRVPSPVRFKHVGKRIYINKNGKLAKGIGSWSIAVDRLFGRIKKHKILAGVSDHPITEYLKHLK